eukprot:142969_1
MTYVLPFIFAVIIGVRNIGACCAGESPCNKHNDNIGDCLDASCEWTCLLDQSQSTPLLAPQKVVIPSSDLASLPPKVTLNAANKDFDLIKAKHLQEQWDKVKGFTDWVTWEKGMKTTKDDFESFQGFIEFDVQRNTEIKLTLNQDMLDYVQQLKPKALSKQDKVEGSTLMTGDDSVFTQRRRLQYKDILPNRVNTAPFNSVGQVSFMEWFPLNDEKLGNIDIYTNTVIETYNKAHQQQQAGQGDGVAVAAWADQQVNWLKGIYDTVKGARFQNYYSRQFNGGSFTDAYGVGAVVKSTTSAFVILTVAHNLVRAAKDGNSYTLNKDITFRRIIDGNIQNDIVFDHCSSIFIAKHNGALWNHNKIDGLDNYDFALAVFQVPNNQQGSIPPPLQIQYAEAQLDYTNIILGDVNHEIMVLMPTYDYESANRRTLRGFLEKWRPSGQSSFGRANHGLQEPNRYKEGMSGSPLLNNQGHIIGVFTAMEPDGNVFGTRFGKSMARLINIAIHQSMSKEAALANFVIWYTVNGGNLNLQLMARSIGYNKYKKYKKYVYESDDDDDDESDKLEEEHIVNYRHLYNQDVDYNSNGTFIVLTIFLMLIFVCLIAMSCFIFG